MDPQKHPLYKELRPIVLNCWKKLLISKIGNFQVGTQIRIQPQVVGFLLQELIGNMLEFKYPKTWRREQEKHDKDIICIPNNEYSFEIKTSSSGVLVGNKSYSEASKGKKEKSGYMLYIHCDKLTELKPIINSIRFGWIDIEDWTGQKSNSGQQAWVKPIIMRKKMLEIY